jgi:Tol biopolymer transport system component
MRKTSATSTFTTALLLGLLSAPWSVGQNDKQGEVLLQAAKNTELVKGDLSAAIEQYRKILPRPGASREVAARALFEMGRCYERLGKEEARKAYEKLVADFADQKELAAQARTRLAALLQPHYPPTINLRRVWAGDVLETPGQPSQDGRYYTFGWETTCDIAVRDLLTGKVRRLTREASWNMPQQYGLGAILSWNNEQVVYHWYASPDYFPELRLISLDGLKRRTLVRSDRERDFWADAWSSDGKQVLTVISKKDLSKQIGFVSVADGSVRILKTLPPRSKVSSTRSGPSAKLSPDGRYIVYDYLSNEDCREHDIFLLPVDGRLEIPLVQHPADDMSPVFTPDGRHVVFASDRTGVWGIWALSVVDGKPEGLPQPVKTDVGQVKSITGITRQGACYYIVEVGREDVYIATVNPETGMWVGGAQPVAGRLMGSSTAPSWSRDGEYLAYLIQKHSNYGYQPGALAIVIRSVRTGEEREISTDLNQMDAPVQWFPDGRAILIGAWEDKYRGDMSYYRIDVQSGAATRMTQAGRVSFPRLSADGKTILYFQARDDSPKGLALMLRQIDTGQTREIQRLPEDFWSAMAISPDSRQVAFIGPATDDARLAAIKVMAISGGEPREILKIGPPEDISGWEGRIAWMPDGQSLLVVRSTKVSRMYQVWRVPLQGGESQRLGAPMERIRFPSVHPDGRRIAFDSGQWKPRQLELWAMENFLPVINAKR